MSSTGSNGGMRLLAAGCMAAMAATAACNDYYDPCFETLSTVTDLRVLAVRADPPEAMVSGSVVPPVDVSVLIVDTGTQRRLSYQAWVCEPTDSKQCPDGSALVAAGSGQVNDDLKFRVQVTPETLARALASDPLRGYGGTRVQLDVQIAVGSGALRASKLLLFSDARPGYVPNHGLEIPKLKIVQQGAPDLLVPDERMPTLAVPDLQFDLPEEATHALGLRPILAAGPGGTSAIEEYDVTDLSGKRVHVQEQITYSFFTTAHLVIGDLGSFGGIKGALSPAEAQAAEPIPGSPEPGFGLVRLNGLASTFGRLWIVAHDGRGGIAWFSTPVTSVDSRKPSLGDGSVHGRVAALEFGCK